MKIDSDIRFSKLPISLWFMKPPERQIKFIMLIKNWTERNMKATDEFMRVGRWWLPQTQTLFMRIGECTWKCKYPKNISKYNCVDRCTISCLVVWCESSLKVHLKFNGWLFLSYFSINKIIWQNCFRPLPHFWPHPFQFHVKISIDFSHISYIATKVLYRLSRYDTPCTLSFSFLFTLSLFAFPPSISWKGKSDCELQNFWINIQSIKEKFWRWQLIYIF